jgi:hypothetical protein
MHLYLVTQTEQTGYDTYDSMVVCASNAYDARLINPSTGRIMTDHDWERNMNRGSWCTRPDLVNVMYIGDAVPGMIPGIICKSFNAG